MATDFQFEQSMDLHSLPDIEEGDEEFDPERQQPTFGGRDPHTSQLRAGGDSSLVSSPLGLGYVDDEFVEEPEPFKPWVPAGANVEKPKEYSYFPDWFTILKSDRKRTAKIALHWDRLYEDALLRQERKQEVKNNLKSHSRAQDVSFRVDFDDETLKERFNCLYEDALNRWSCIEDREQAAIREAKQLDVAGNASEKLAQLPPEEREAKIMEFVERMYSARNSPSPKRKDAKESASQPKPLAKRCVNEQRINDLYLNHFIRLKEQERKQDERNKKEEEELEEMERELKERSLAKRRALRLRLGEEPDGKTDFEALSKRSQRKPVDDTPGVQDQVRRPAKQVDEIFNNLYQQGEHRRELMENLRSEKLMMDKEAWLHPPSQLTKEEVEEIRNRLYKPRTDFAEKAEDGEPDQPPSTPPRPASPDWHERMYAVAEKQNLKIEERRKEKEANEAKALRGMQFSISRSKQRVLHEESLARLSKQPKVKISQMMNQKKNAVPKYKAPPATAPDFVHRLYQRKPRVQIREHEEKPRESEIQRTPLPRSPCSIYIPTHKGTDARARLQRQAQGFFGPFAPPSRINQGQVLKAGKASDSASPSGRDPRPDYSRGHVSSQLEMVMDSPKVSHKARLELPFDPRTGGLSQGSARRVLYSKLGSRSTKLRGALSSPKGRHTLKQKAAGYTKLSGDHLIQRELEKFIHRPEGKAPSPRCHLRDVSPPNVPKPYYKRQQAALIEKKRQHQLERRKQVSAHSQRTPRRVRLSMPRAHEHFDGAISRRPRPSVAGHSDGSTQRHSRKFISAVSKASASPNMADSNDPPAVPISFSRETSVNIRRSYQVSRETSGYGRHSHQVFGLDTAELHRKLSLDKNLLERPERQVNRSRQWRSDKKRVEQNTPERRCG
eukprot:GEMP01005691.1.p1 GENE.GEMP01005691.1~~GEMP01005691.1.p1  ORF type:complete len:896 (+),score=196.48 GEMP01005691.1:427-3114(+)